MVNLKAFIAALKSSWFRRFLNTDSKWQAFIKIHIEIDKLTGCHNKYIEEKIKVTKNQFWVDTLQAFINIVENIQVTKDVLLKRPNLLQS